MPSCAQHDDPRTVARVPMQLHAKLQAGDAVDDGEVVDLSRDGAQVRTDKAWSIGQELHVTLEQFGSCRGHVVWNRDGAIGIKFADEFVMLTLLVGGWCSFGG